MATPPEDDFPTKTTAEALRADRDRTGASKMTVEIEPSGPLHGIVINVGGKIRSDGDPIVVEPPGQPSVYNQVPRTSPEYAGLEERRRERAEARRAQHEASPMNLARKTDPDYERLRESRARAAEARELRAKALRESGDDDRYRLADACARATASHRSQAEVKATYRILSSLEDIGPRAQSLLVKIAERLAHGARQYGDFDDRPRDWNLEALEEHMDAVVYMAMACMERDEAKAADKARAEAACRGPSTTTPTAMPPLDMRHYNIDPRDGAGPLVMPSWPLTTPGEDWEKTRDGCG